MITVSIVSGNQHPVEEGIEFELVSDGNAISCAKTDSSGVVSFDVVSSGLKSVAIRLKAVSEDSH